MNKQKAHKLLALAAAKKGYRVQIHKTAKENNLRLVAPDGRMLATTLKVNASKGYNALDVSEALKDIENLNCAAETSEYGDFVEGTRMSPRTVDQIPGIEKLRQFYDVKPYSGLTERIRQGESWCDPQPATDRNPSGLLAYATLKSEFADMARGFPFKGNRLGITGRGFIGPMVPGRIGRSGTPTNYGVDSKSTVASFVESLKLLDLERAQATEMNARERQEWIRAAEQWAYEVFRAYVFYPKIKGRANPKRGTAGVIVAGQPKSKDEDLEAVLSSTEAYSVAESLGLQIESVEYQGTATLPMSRGKTGPQYSISFSVLK